MLDFRYVMKASFGLSDFPTSGLNLNLPKSNISHLINNFINLYQLEL